MTLIFKCIAGSRMFGVHNEHSDYDYKGVYLLPQDQRAKRPKADSINTVDPETGGEELFHFEAFLDLCEQGQTIPYEMLFCPPENVVSSSPLWERIVANRDKLIHKNITSFFGMAQQQAMRYSEKGNRIQAFLAVKDLLLSKDQSHKLRDYRDEVKAFSDNADFKTYRPKKLVDFYSKEKNGMVEDFLEVCDTKLGLNHKISTHVKIINDKLSVYGKRALEAFKNDAVDYKALSHAVRISIEAQELLKDHKITLPLKPADRDLVLAIKSGKMPKDEILALVEKSLQDLKAVEGKSDLPEAAEATFIQLLKDQYKAGDF